MTEFSGNFDVAPDGGPDLGQRLFVGLAPGRTRKNVRGQGDVDIAFVALEGIYLETVFLGRLHLLVSFYLRYAYLTSSSRS